MSLALYPRAFSAARTRASVTGRTPGSWLTTRETVLRLTPALPATSTMVGRSPIPSPSSRREREAFDNVVNARAKHEPREVVKRGGQPPGLSCGTHGRGGVLDG